jgi:TRAP-type mannitol/chloroaromatic compound transport system substrate-binding protein
MERRRFIGTAGLAGILASGIAPAAHATQSTRWRLASSFPSSLTVTYSGADILARTLKDISKGRFEITVFPADELMPAHGVLDGVRRGNVECGHSAGYYYIDQDETFALDTALPFGLNSRQMTAWMCENGGPGFRLIRDFHRSQGIVGLPLGNTGAQMGGWFRKPIRSLADLKGLKMRIPGLGAKVLERLGVLPQSIPAGRLYQALTDGTIDAVEWSGPHDDHQLGLHRIVPYYAYPGWWEGGSQLSLYINQRAYDALTPENKAMLNAAAKAAHLEVQGQHDLKNPLALKALVAEGARLIAFPENVLDAARKAALALYAEIGDRNPRWKRIYTEYEQFLKTQAWGWGYTELAFNSYMHRQTIAAEKPARGKRARQP